ncbi:MAG: hypothetical protein ACRDNK_10195 [Solirubrobacteraceae bacterium]
MNVVRGTIGDGDLSYRSGWYRGPADRRTSTNLKADASLRVGISVVKEDRMRSIDPSAVEDQPTGQLSWLWDWEVNKPLSLCNGE